MSVEDILYRAMDEGIYKEVMAASKSLEGNGKSYYTVADKFEEAYQLVIKKKKENEKRKSDNGK